MVLEELWPARDDGRDHCTIDVIAVHGLGEDHITAWVDSNNHTLWLRDFLPKFLPSSRILTYGYSAGGISSWQGSSERILQHAQTLVAELEADRFTSNAAERPIIFICHGVGGILVKKALAYSSSRLSKNVAHLYSIFVSTYGLLFLGTPHEGIDSVNWTPITRGVAEVNQTTCAISGAITRGSETLQSINDQFAPLSKQFHIHLFWEQKTTITPTGAGYVVEEKSAAPIWADTERSGIWADHSQMCKFGNMEAPGFVVVRATLQRYSQSASNTIAHRWTHAMQLLTHQRNNEAAELVGYDVYNNSKPFLYVNNETPRRNKHYHVPYNASTIFTGRDEIIKRLEHSLLSGTETEGSSIQKRFIVYGLGGSGKTQFCLKYVQDHRQDYWGVFWIDASSAENAEGGFARIAQIDGFGKSFDDGKNLLTSSEMSWLLIIDNADDPSIDVATFFPAGNRGHILVTSRNPECRYHQTIGYEELKGMSQDEAVTLLLRAAGKECMDQKFRDLAEPIAESLGYLPLALDQAGAAIRQNICTLKSYLHLYRRHRKQVMGTRSIQGGEHYKYTVYSTWEVSFQMIKKLDTPAALDACEILQIFSFFHSQRVPAVILQKAWNNTRDATAPVSKSIIFRLLDSLKRTTMPWRPLESLRIMHQNGQTWDFIRFQSALSILAQFSLITKDAENDGDFTPRDEVFSSKETYSMHPLVHFWARDRLEIASQKMWFEISATALADSITLSTEAGEYAYRRCLIPHIDALIEGEHVEPLIDQETDDNGLKRAFKLAQVYFEAGRWKSARELQEKVVDARAVRLGTENPDTLEAMTCLGEAYWNSGRNDQAAKWQRKVLDTRTRLLGPKDPDTLIAMDKLADTYWLCGLMSEAEELGVKAVTGMESTFGLEDVRTLTATLNLARVYKHQDCPAKALKLQSHVKAVCERIQGVEEPLSLRAKMEVGVSYNDLGRHAEAEILLLAVLEARERILGKEHAYTLWTANDISKVYCAQGRLKEAEDILSSVLEVAIRTLGQDHVGTQMTKTNVARVYSGQGRFPEASALLQDVSATLERKIKAGELDPLHPDRVAILCALARNYLQQRRVLDAEKLFIQAYQLTESKLGPDDSRTLKLRAQLDKVQKGRNTQQAVKHQGTQRTNGSQVKSSTW